MATTDFAADLHLHSTASDGVITPEAVIRLAKDAGMDAVAVTDHDTVSGVARAVAAAGAASLNVLTGLELTAGGDEEIHLLAYGIDPADAKLLAFLDSQLAERRARMHLILEKLAALGMPVDPEETADPAGRFMGRMNLAFAMVARGYVPTVRAAFDQYLNRGRPAYVPRRRIEVPRGVEILRGFGAVVSLAHPGRLKIDESAVLSRLPGWIEAGLSGIEAYHASHDEATCLHYDRVARRFGLLVTGGSDCHGREGVRVGEHLRHWRTVREDYEALAARIRVTRSDA